MGELRNIAPSFVASGPSGVAVRTRLKHLTPDDEKVLRLVGAHLARSGDGRHRPLLTGEMSKGIGPSRPDQASLGVREPAPASPDHGHDPCRPDAE